MRIIIYTGRRIYARTAVSRDMHVFRFDASSHLCLCFSFSFSVVPPCPRHLCIVLAERKKAYRNKTSVIYIPVVPIPPGIYVYMHIHTYCVIRFRFTLSCSLDTVALPHPSYYNTNVIRNLYAIKQLNVTYLS